MTFILNNICFSINYDNSFSGLKLVEHREPSKSSVFQEVRVFTYVLNRSPNPIVLKTTNYPQK